MQWAMRIEHALDHDQFVLFARVSKSWEKSYGIRAEALLRMVQDDGDNRAAVLSFRPQSVSTWLRGSTSGDAARARLAEGTARSTCDSDAVHQLVRSLHRRPGLSPARHPVLRERSRICQQVWWK